LGERIGSAHYYFLKNAIGSIVAVINGSGQTVSDRYGYDPYGNTTYSSVTVANPFGYAGGYTDATGLVHFGARYYDPSTARWTQVDPQASEQSSAYAYGADDPINETDITGLHPRAWTGISYQWWGVQVFLSHAVASRVFWGLAVGAGVSWLLSEFGFPALVAPILTIYAGWIGWVNSDDRYGVVINRDRSRRLVITRS
jgi:RHS repeat-associated protein